MILKKAIVYVVPDTVPIMFITAPSDGTAVTEGDAYDIKGHHGWRVFVTQVNLLRSSEEEILTDVTTNAVFYARGNLVEGSPALDAVTLEVNHDSITTALDAAYLSAPDVPGANMKVSPPDILMEIIRVAYGTVTAGVSFSSIWTRFSGQNHKQKFWFLSREIFSGNLAKDEKKTNVPENENQ